VKKAYSAELKALGKKIKKLRLSHKITQETLADLCEIDVRTIQRIEKGEFGLGLPTVYAIAEAFKMSVSDLLRD